MGMPGRLAKGEQNFESGALAGFAMGSYMATVVFDNFLANGKA